jgi:hypothetical protein
METYIPELDEVVSELPAIRELPMDEQRTMLLRLKPFANVFIQGARDNATCLRIQWSENTLMHTDGKPMTVCCLQFSYTSQRMSKECAFYCALREKRSSDEWENVLNVEYTSEIISTLEPLYTYRVKLDLLTPLIRKMKGKSVVVSFGKESPIFITCKESLNSYVRIITAPQEEEE